MPTPVSVTVESKSGRLFVLYSDGSVEAIRIDEEPYRDDPGWETVAPPNPKAVEDAEEKVPTPSG